MSSSHETLRRQWQMLRLAPRYPKKITAREVLENLLDLGFSATKRTIERDLQTLSEIFPLTCDEREKPFGWSWQKDAPSFDLPGLSPEEALAVKLVDLYVSPLMPSAVISRLRPHFKEADAVLKRESKPKYASWVTKVRVVPATQPLVPPVIKLEAQGAIYEALLNDRQIKTTYQKRSDPEPIEYTISPLALVQRGPVTYLIATIFNYSDICMFDVHRFRKVEILNEPVKRPTDFDLDRYVASGAMGFGNGKKIKLEALFSREAVAHLYETPLSEDQALRPQSKTHTKVIATVANTPQLVWWLLGFGDAVEVLGPTKLRASMASTALSMSRNYYRSDSLPIATEHAVIT